MDILPAGENGLVNAHDLGTYAAQGARPANSEDQIAPYTGLIYHSSGLTDANLHDSYIDESFGVRPSDVVRTEHPDPAVRVVIYRDKHDIPHIYGASLEAMAYGAGFAGAEDRLFLMDVLRHYAEGDLMTLLGPACNYESMDYQALMSKGYTRSDLQAQLDAMPKRFGAMGASLVSMIDAYVAGVNRYLTEARSDPSLMPVEYQATGATPEPWSPVDVVAISTLIALEATGGGNEVQNAALLEYLASRLGPANARAVFDDLKEQNDPAAPTTISRSFPYMIPSHVDPSLSALPDQAPLALTDLAGAPPELTASCTGGSNSPQGQVGGGTSSTALSQQLNGSGGGAVGESNAVVISAARSRDGHPIAVFGPELGYYGPQILMQEDLHAPGYAAAGAAFPGTNFVIELGRGTDYAWSATTSSTDQVDMRVEELCQPGGGAPQREGTFYLFRGRCVPMTSHTFTDISPGSAPVTLTRTLHRTVHGVVQGWSTVGGRPVAIVRQDATTGHDLDQLAGLLQFGMPSVASTPQGWMRAVNDVAYGFNWFYLDSHDIAYDVSGRDPVRNPHADPNLPTWGTGAAEWRSFLAPSAHPHAVDPESGYLVSWNNKPAPGFSASDDLFAWGPVFRSQLLTAGLASAFRIHHGELDRAQLAATVEGAATQDLDAFALVGRVLRLLEPDLGTAPAGVREMAGQLEQWANEGFHRRQVSPRAGQYQDAASIAIWDEVYPGIVEAFFDSIFAAGGVEQYMGLPDGYDRMTMLFSDTPNDVGQHDGDGFYSGWEGYVQKALDQISGHAVPQPFSGALRARLCGPISGSGVDPSDTSLLDRCRSSVLAAFTRAESALVAANGGSTDVARWTADTNTLAASAASGSLVTVPQFDQIEFQQVGAIPLPSMPWQNRPTYQQVVEFPKTVRSASTFRR